MSGEPVFLAHGVRSGGLTSLLVADGLDTEVRVDKDASPLGDLDRDPVGIHPGGRRQLVGHRRLPRTAPDHDHPKDHPTAAVTAQQLTVTWADARVTTCTLPDQSPTSSSTRATAPDVTTTKRRAP